MHVVLWVCLGLGVVYGCDCDCYLLCLSLLVAVCWLPGGGLVCVCFDAGFVVLVID